MFRLWGKVFKSNHMIKDHVAVDDRTDVNRTKKVYSCLEEICHKFDLSAPIWLDVNIRDFINYDKTRFTKDSFMESVDFDYLEIHVIEEDD